MPATYNGIGTHYYGKRNLTIRQAVCPHCHRTVQLKSYDTRLWFVVVFIPVIPLGRKRIVDQCPSCSRHFVVDKQKWETAKQLEISGAEEAYRKNPTPEGAVAVHQQLLRFHEAARAEEFQKVLAETYADHAKVQAYLGAALLHLGLPDQSAAFYQKALALRPDLPEARTGVSEAHLRAGRLDEARKLLDFLEKPGAAQLYSLRPLEILGIAYQKAGRHSEALELFGRLMAELPNILQINSFRNMVRKSEKALARTESILPKTPFSWRRLFSFQPWKQGMAGGRLSLRTLTVLAVIFVLIALGFLISNEYTRRHRTVYILNSYPQPVTVRISGAEPVPAIRGFGEVHLVEGTHHVSINGPVRQELDLQISSSYFSRWADKPVWVINVGGAGILLLQQVTYGHNARPPAYSFRFGHPVEFFSDVDYAFTDLPETIQMHSGETRVLSQLQIFHGRPDAVFEHLKREGRPSDALNFAETVLHTHPADKPFVDAYAAECTRLHQVDRLEKYLAAGLSNRPVAIEWHRWYQRLHEAVPQRPQLISQYDDMLANDPNNSALLYLRGRIDPNRSQCKAFFERAARNDPKNPFPFFALGWDQMVAGDWSAAHTNIARAVELDPEDYGFSHALWLIRLALGEANVLEKEARAALRQKPLEISIELQLIQALAAEGKMQEATRESVNFERQFLAKHGRAARPATDLVHREALYVVGDFAGLANFAQQDFSPTGRLTLFQALVEQGQTAEAMSLPLPSDSSEDKAFWLLALSVELFHAGDTNAAADWRAKATEAMCQASPELARVAPLLSQANAPTSSEVQTIVLPPQAKAIFMAALSQLHPHATELALTARRFNVDRHFPYHLVERVTAPLGPVQLQ